MCRFAELGLFLSKLRNLPQDHETTKLARHARWWVRLTELGVAHEPRRFLAEPTYAADVLPALVRAADLPVVRRFGADYGLSTSQVLQCFKDGLPPLDHHPMKTMEVTARRVYDAKAPCPRSGNPLCHCSEATGATMPTENVWADPSADAVFDPAETPSIRELQRITDPRTGEEQLLHDMSRGTKADSAFSRFWSYGVKGFEASDAPLPNMYAYNGATERGSAPESGRLGASTDVLRYKPEYLRKMLAREPWRRAQLVTELKAAGIDVDEVGEKDECCKE